jgi:predicted restriction endonuclease
MLLISDDPFSPLQRGARFEVGQIVHLAGSDNLVCRVGRITEVDGDIASVEALEDLAPDDRFRMTDTRAIRVVAIRDLSFSPRAVRHEQSSFRDKVLERCGYRCVLTGCSVQATLEAAHLPGRDWRLHNEAEDGIALRVDIHRLFDAGLIRLDGDMVIVSDDLARTEYAELDGIRLSLESQ